MWPMPLVEDMFERYRRQLVDEVYDMVVAGGGPLETKADKVAGATAGNLAALDGSGNLADSLKKASDFAVRATTLAGYGITDAKIANGTVTLGANSITPLISHQDISGKADKATTLAGYGITDAYIKTETDGKISTAVSAEAQARDTAIANAISAVKDSAPEAFDTLKEIADWIGDDQSGAAAMAAQISSHSSQLSQLSQNKVDKVAGKGLSTNDYTTDEKTKLGGVEAGAKDNVVEAAGASGFPQAGAAGKIYVAKDENKTYRWNGSQYVQVGGGGGSSVEVVSPSTDPADAGKAADAKATGDEFALRPTKSQMDAGWWSDWSCDPATYNGEPLTVRESDDVYAIYIGDSVDGSINKSGDEDSLVFRAGMTWSGGVDVTATRRRVCAPVPTKPEDIDAQPAGSYASPSDIGIPAFSTTATYALGAKVVYGNALWNCTTAVSTAGAWNASNWTKICNLSADATPTANSNALVTSGGIKDAIDEATKLTPAYSNWEFLVDEHPAINEFSLRYEVHSSGGGEPVEGWYPYVTLPGSSPVQLSSTGKGTPESTSLMWTQVEMDLLPAAFERLTATRKKADGYFLGGRTNSALADATKVDERFAGKQDALSAAQLANIAAVPNKADSAAIAPAYDSTAAYSVGDVATYDGRRYKCNTAIATGGETWTAAHWTEESVQAAKQDAISDLAAIRSGAQAGATAVQPAALRYDLPADATAISSASSEVIEGVTVNYGSATLADRTANRVAITAALDELRLTFPAADSGKVRDFELRVEVGTGSAALTAPALVPIAATGETVTLENPDGEIPALADGSADAKGVMLLYFSETAPGKFLVKGEEVKEA